MRRAQKEIRELTEIQDLPTHSIQLYRQRFILPRLKELNLRIFDLVVTNPLVLSDGYYREYVNMVSVYDPNRHNLDLKQGLEPPKPGEAVVITFSPIYEVTNKGVQPIFEAEVRPLQYT